MRIVVLAMFVMFFAAACSAADDSVGSSQTTQDGGGSSGGGGDDSGGDGGNGGDGSDDDGSGTDPSSGGDGPDNDDAAEIIGNPDLDLDELAEIDPDTAETLDEIDDLVSIGDCQSETVGLRMTYVPDGWQCRVLDQAIGGLDGFTLFKPQNAGGIEITIGTPSPIGSPCEALQACDSAEPLDLGSNFNVESFSLAGIPFIYGTHVSVMADLGIVILSAPTDDDYAFMTMVLNGVEEF